MSGWGGQREREGERRGERVCGGWAVCRTPRSDVPACCNEGQSSLCSKRQLFTFARELSCSTKHRRIIARIRLCVMTL